MTKNDKKTIFGWCMYDWANSAYITTVVVAILPNYFSKVIVGEKDVTIGNTVFSATSLWAYMVSGAAFFVFLFAPVLGAISDFSVAKKKFLMFFAYMGSLSALLLYFCQSGDVRKTVIIFMISQIGFVGANIFYDAFLPQIASEDKLDWVSGKGFFFGYVGGGLQFAISLGLVAGHEMIGINQGLAARIAMTMAGLWWAGFSLLTVKYLREGEAVEQMPAAYRGKPKLIAYTAIGLTRIFATAKKDQTLQTSATFPSRLHDLQRWYPDGNQYGDHLWHRRAGVFHNGFNAYSPYHPDRRRRRCFGIRQVVQ
jgi:UMF1 family MFS transporter